MPSRKANNTILMQSPHDVCAIHSMEKDNNPMNKENVIGIDALYESLEKCSKGVRWKGTVAYYRHNWTDEIEKLSNELHNGTYKERKPKCFTVTEPKYREIMSIHFRDRIYQRSLNDVAIYPQASVSYIADNFACQKGKGTKAARGRLSEFLHRYYRKYGAEGYILKIDIKGYYPNMSHAYVSDMFNDYMDEETYQMAMGVLDRIPGEVGYNPGSQIVQIVGITALDKLDHYIKERLRIKFYIRYMDDFIILHHDKNYLQNCLNKIKTILAKQDMEVSEKKTFIQKISDPVKFLGFVYRLTPSGKVVILADPAKIKHEKLKINRMLALVEKGKLTLYEVDRHFKAYKAGIRYGNCGKLLCKLNLWYGELRKGYVKNG